jgi:uncharacterized protein (TIGR00369 family)
MCSPQDCSSDAVAIADVWQEVPPSNDFVRRLGPLVRRQDGDGWRYALRVEAGHRNGAGGMHGGALAAFLDEVAGTVASDLAGRRHVTVQMAINFLRPVAAGEVLEARCAILAVTGSMTFVDAKAFVADALVATASLVLKGSRTTE